ncbi:hypothetical protein N9W17_02210 [Jannaschia sp.]|nr:hypothetical protein [Jannaschia sp.]
MIPAQTDLVVIETQARALRAAFFLHMMSSLVSRLRFAPRAARA